MRELAAFYCPECGYYAYYQTSRHPCCPRCGDGHTPMRIIRMHYKEFMAMDCEERDNYIAQEILKDNPSLIDRIAQHQQRYRSREVIAELCNVIRSLETENKILNDTVAWMHDTIWQMVREQRGLSGDSAGASAPSGGQEPALARFAATREPEH